MASTLKPLGLHGPAAKLDPVLRFKHFAHRTLNPLPDRKDPVSRGVNGFLFGLILVNILAVILETVQPLRAKYADVFKCLEIVSVCIFTAEYGLRLWTADLKAGYSAPFWGRVRYIFSPLALFDLFAFLPFYLPWFIPLDLRFLRALRLLRMVRLLKIVRYAKSLRLMAEVLRKKKEELLLTFSFLLVFLLFTSTLMYYIERGVQPDKFASIPEAMWWGVVTLTTVGYGDVYPLTPLGKILAAVIAVLGIGLFALPAGVIAAGLIESVQKNNAGGKCPHCGKDL